MSASAAAPVSWAARVKRRSKPTAGCCRKRSSSSRSELEQVRRTRQLHRAKRKKVPHPIVALVGYTNAGKSTLFNRITGAGVLAEDMLFATLDPTLRRMKLPHGRTVILSDTVGFISDLPTHLVAAFRATLEEVLEADLILHVRDMSDPDNQAQARTCCASSPISASTRPRAQSASSKSGTRSTGWNPEAHDATRAEGGRRRKRRRRFGRHAARASIT